MCLFDEQARLKSRYREERKINSQNICIKKVFCELNLEEKVCEKFIGTFTMEEEKFELLARSTFIDLESWSTDQSDSKNKMGVRMAREAEGS